MSKKPHLHLASKINMGKEAAMLKDFFDSSTMPNSIKLNKHEHINDTAKFVKSHLSIVHRNIGNKYFEPHLFRLAQLKEVLNTAAIKE